MPQVFDESRLIMSDELVEKMSHLTNPTEHVGAKDVSISAGGKVFSGTLEGISSTRKKVTVDIMLAISMPTEISLCIIKGGRFDYIDVLGERIDGKKIRNISMRDIEAVDYTNLSISFAKE